MSSIMTHWLLSGSLPALPYYVLLASGSFVAGMIILDLERVVLGSFISFGLCVLIMFMELSLPVFVGALSDPALSEVVYTEAIRNVFKALFPIPFVLNAVMSILGGYFGERYLTNV